jgi:uncharacterized protein (TIRG00374 family)
MWMKKSWILLLLASIILSLAVPFLLGGLDQFRLLHLLSWWAALLLVGLAMVSWGFNAWRTRFLVGSLGLSIRMVDAGLTTMSAEFAGVTTPGAVGMAATYTYLYHDMGISVGEAVGLVGIIMVTDLIYFGSIMSLAALAQVAVGLGSRDTLRVVVVVMGVVVGSAVGLFFLVRNYRSVCRFIARQMGRVSWLARRRYSMARGLVHFLRALRTLRQMSRWQLAKLYFITLGFWLPRYLVLIVVIVLVGHYVPLAYLFLVQGVLNLGGQAFLLPGGGGTVDAGYAAFLSPYLPREALSFTLLVWRTYTFYWLLAVGAPIFLFTVGRAAHDFLIRKT